MIVLNLLRKHLEHPHFMLTDYDRRKGRNKVFLRPEIVRWLHDVGAVYRVDGFWVVGGGFYHGSFVADPKTGKREATITFYNDGAAALFKMSEWWES